MKGSYRGRISWALFVGVNCEVPLLWSVVVVFQETAYALSFGVVIDFVFLVKENAS